MSQPQVAKELGVDVETVLCWEHNRNKPTVKYASKIIQFLGYFPFQLQNQHIGIQMKYARMISGMTVADVAKEINVDCGTIGLVEKGKRKPMSRVTDNMKKYIDRKMVNLLT